MSNSESGFETLAFADVKRWTAEKLVVDNAVSALRAAKSDREVAAATERLYMAAARARDFEKAAIYLMRRYGHADGIDVPEIGRVRVRWLDDGMTVLEKAP